MTKDSENVVGHPHVKLLDVLALVRDLFPHLQKLMSFERSYEGLRTWLYAACDLAAALAKRSGTTLDDEAACLLRDVVADDEQYGHLYAVVSAALDELWDEKQPQAQVQASVMANAHARAVPAHLALAVVACLQALRQ